MTYAPASLTALARYWTAHGGVNLGVVGDTRHKAKGRSYHLGASALTSDAYSRKTARDRAGLSEAASALDLGRLNGSLPALRKFSVWLVGRCRANAPGTQDIREIIYSPDGKVVLRWDRERGVNSDPKPGEAALSHLGHTHISFYRDSEKRPKTAAFAPYFAKPESPKEAPVSERTRLGAAIKTISEKYLGNVIKANDSEGVLKWSTRLGDYATRLAATAAPKLTKAEAADTDVPEPLSPIASVAYAQLLAASGAVGVANDPLHPLNLTYSPGDVLAGSTPDANRLLALLGFFGQPGQVAGADYSLFERFYSETPAGLDANGQPTEGNWVLKDPSTDPWVAYSTGQ